LQKRKREKLQIQTVTIGGVGKGEGPRQRTMEVSKTGRGGDQVKAVMREASNLGLDHLPKKATKAQMIITEEKAEVGAEVEAKVTSVFEEKTYRVSQLDYLHN